MNELIHLRLDRSLRREIKKTVDANLFSNESEFVRDAIRKSVENYRKIELLESLRHSIPKRGLKDKSKDIFGEFGIE